MFPCNIALKKADKSNNNDSISTGLEGKQKKGESASLLHTSSEADGALTTKCHSTRVPHLTCSAARDGLYK